MTNNHNGEEDGYNTKIQELVNIIFKNIANSNIEQDQARTYPESILQQTQNANKYYNSFQRHTKQFIDETNTQGDVVRWSNSVIQHTLKSIIDSWQAVDVKGIMNDSAENEEDKVSKKEIQSTANTLFSWSSGDSYIESRRRELQHRNDKADTPITSHANILGKKETNKEEEQTSLKKDKLLKSLYIEPPKESITNKLNRIVDRESNKFIHRRIQLIKAHHSEQISKEIHERKRKDHELHLNKLKQKEEEYEKRLHAATNDQGRQNKFFGSLFGFSAGTTANSNESLEEKDHKSPNLNVTSSPSGKNKRFSFLPGTSISLWGHTGTANKNTKLPKDTDEIETDHSLNIHLPTKESQKDVPLQAPLPHQNQNSSIQRTLKPKKEAKEEDDQLESAEVIENGGEKKKDNQIDSDHEADEEEDEFEEFSSSIPNISINLDPIQPKINKSNDASQNTDNLLDI